MEEEQNTEQRESKKGMGGEEAVGKYRGEVGNQIRLSVAIAGTHCDQPSSSNLPAGAACRCGGKRPPTWQQ
eukprot:326442-Chlamydomonas_euryale.AAC.1